MKCIICNTETGSDNKRTCTGSCRAKSARARKRTLEAHATITRTCFNMGEVMIDACPSQQRTRTTETLTVVDTIEQPTRSRVGGCKCAIPGDEDYTGVCECVDGKWQVKPEHAGARA